MSGRVVNLNRERWLAMASLALTASSGLRPEDADALGAMAGRMQSATPPASEPVAMTGCLAFRWACQHFAFADPALRLAAAEGLRCYAWEVRRIFDDAPPPQAVAVAVPAPTPLIGEVREAPSPRVDLYG